MLLLGVQTEGSLSSLVLCVCFEIGVNLSVPVSQRACARELRRTNRELRRTNRALRQQMLGEESSHDRQPRSKRDSKSKAKKDKGKKKDKREVEDSDGSAELWSSDGSASEKESSQVCVCARAGR